MSRSRLDAARSTRGVGDVPKVDGIGVNSAVFTLGAFGQKRRGYCEAEHDNSGGQAHAIPQLCVHASTRIQRLVHTSSWHLIFGAIQPPQYVVAVGGVPLPHVDPAVGVG